jgi:hypothetical protein
MDALYYLLNNLDKKLTVPVKILHWLLLLIATGKKKLKMIHCLFTWAAA